MIGVTLRNDGGGIGKAAFVMLAAEGRRVHAWALDGFLRPGEGYRFATDIESHHEGQISVVAYCRDANEIQRAWSAHGGSKVYRRGVLRRAWYPERARIFYDLYRDVDFEVLPFAGYRIEPLPAIEALGAPALGGDAAV